MQRHEIGLVLDVGANCGQFGFGLRGNGYKGRIVSFEPSSDAFKTLRMNITSMPNWEIRQEAVGGSEGKAVLNCSKNSESSSLLQPTIQSIAFEPSITIEKTEEVVVKNLASIWKDLDIKPETRVLLKLDTQGLEYDIIVNCQTEIQKSTLIMLEASFFHHYEGEILASDVIFKMQDMGWRIIDVAPAWQDPRTGEVHQVDLLFRKAVNGA